MSNTAAVNRVTTTIGVVKWIAVASFVLAAVVLFFIGAVSGEGMVFGVMLLLMLQALVGAGAAWVLFGWFEHSLRLFNDIAVGVGGQKIGNNFHFNNLDDRTNV